MELTTWLAFFAASLTLAVIPGPGVASIVGFAVGSGRRVALAAVAGMAVGNATAITVSLAGAGAVLATSALAFTVLKWAGAAWLIVIGLLAIAKSGGATDSAAPNRAVGARAAFMTTMAVGIFHPKTILFYIAFATQFIRPDQSWPVQAAIMIFTHTGVAAVTDSLYALAASRAADAMRGPRVRRWAQRAGDGVLVSAGIATSAMSR